MSWEIRRQMQHQWSQSWTVRDELLRLAQVSISGSSCCPPAWVHVSHSSPWLTRPCPWCFHQRQIMSSDGTKKTYKYHRGTGNERWIREKVYPCSLIAEADYSRLIMTEVRLTVTLAEISLDSLKFTAHTTFDGCYRSSDIEVTLKTGLNWC